MNTERRKLLAVALTALAIWATALTTMAYGSGPQDEVIVWASRDRLGEMLAASPASVVAAGLNGFVVLRGDAPQFVSALYARGAWIVLPARRAGGCAGARPRRLGQ
jgi:hypothetical protein